MMMSYFRLSSLVTVLAATRIHTVVGQNPSGNSIADVSLLAQEFARSTDGHALLELPNILEARGMTKSLDTIRRLSSARSLSGRKGKRKSKADSIEDTASCKLNEKKCCSVVRKKKGGMNTKCKCKKESKLWINGHFGKCPCDVSKINLSDYPQWEAEKGYWVGDYSFYGPDGDAYTSASWNYPYDHYKGFITGNTKGGSYRQRNVFVYPKQVASKCKSTDDNGDEKIKGSCGVNGQTKLFKADQSTPNTCTNNPELGGDIEGPYGLISYTYTQLVGQEDAVLYQVYALKEALALFEATSLMGGNPFSRCHGPNYDGTYICGSGCDQDINSKDWSCEVNAYPEDKIIQSQLTTLTTKFDGTKLRTRTAQGFDIQTSEPSYASFYREAQVNEDEFFSQLETQLSTDNVLETDICALLSGETGGSVFSGGNGFEYCKKHLKESDEL